MALPAHSQRCGLRPLLTGTTATARIGASSQTGLIVLMVSALDAHQTRRNRNRRCQPNFRRTPCGRRRRPPETEHRCAMLRACCRAGSRDCRFLRSVCQRFTDPRMSFCIFARKNLLEMFLLKRWPAAFRSLLMIRSGCGGLWANGEFLLDTNDPSAVARYIELARLAPAIQRQAAARRRGHSHGRESVKCTGIF